MTRAESGSQTHIVSARQFNREWIENFFEDVDRIRRDPDIVRRQRTYHRESGTVAYLLFYEPSTRTSNSFKHAAIDLGIAVIATENASEFSSAAKGENLEDTIRVCCEYGPAMIVLRHPEQFAADVAVGVVERWGYRTIIINAGDGANEHPTQALTDLYTIWCEIGRVHGLRIVIGGDLLYGRAARSLIFLLTLFQDNHLTLVAPEQYGISGHVREFLEAQGVSFVELQELFKHDLSVADVVYWTRPQLERASGLQAPGDVWKRGGYIFSKRHLEDLSKNAIILHPLPRTNELPSEIDSDSRARYFKQAGYGKLVRTALMMQALNKTP